MDVEVAASDSEAWSEGYRTTYEDPNINSCNLRCNFLLSSCHYCLWPIISTILRRL